MSGQTYLKKIAIVGASGRVGASTLKHLLETNNSVAMTVISRAESDAQFPDSPRVTVRRGSYDDAEFLQSAFQGNELAMFSLSFAATATQPRLIDAAAKAGVKWIVPNEYAGNGKDEAMFSAVPPLQPKLAAQKQIEELAKTHEGLKWIGVATNPWTELSITMGMFGFNVPKRTATLYSGTGPFNSCSMERVGLGIARLLSLPLTSAENPRASLQHYANNYVYISSFSVTQLRLFDSVKRVTGTSDEDWTIERRSTEDRIRASEEKLAAGNTFAGFELLYAYYMGAGMGGDYEAMARGDREVLGLEEEDLDQVVRGALAAMG